MKAVIMAGGGGTRLRPLTCDLPKPMVPILNSPMMEHIVNLLKRYDLTRIASTLWYMPEKIQDYFRDGSNWGVEMEYYIEDEPLGTAGSVKNAQSFLDETFVVVSGDSLTDINLQKAIDFHKEKGAMATLVLTRVANPLSYGVVITNEEGRITQFLEKPSWCEVFSDTVNTGIYVLEPEVLDVFGKGENYDFSKDLFPKLLRQKAPLYGYVADEYWSDVGNLEVYRQAQKDCLDKKVAIKLPKEIHPGVYVEDDIDLPRDIQFSGPAFIGRGSKIESGVMIGPYTVIGSNCQVEKGTSIKHTTLWSGVQIGPNCEIRGAVIAKQAKIAAKVRLYEGVVVGDRTTIGTQVKISPNVKIWPEKSVPSGTRLTQTLVWGSQEAPVLFSKTGICGDIRGALTPENIVKIGLGYGEFIGKNKTLLVTSDRSALGKLAKTALIAGLVSSGVDVLDGGVVGGNVTRFGIQSFKTDGALHCECLANAGSNEVNIRCWDERGFLLSKAQQRKIETILQSEDFSRLPSKDFGQHRYVSGLEEEYVKKLAEIYREHVKTVPVAVLDTGSGDLTFLVKEFLRELNCEIVDPAAKSKKRPFLFIKLGKNGWELLDENQRTLNDDQLWGLRMLAARLRNKDRIAIPLNISQMMERIAENTKQHIQRTKLESSMWMEVAAELGNNYHDPKGEIDFFPHIEPLVSIGEILSVLSSTDKPASQVCPKIKTYRSEKATLCPWDAKGWVMRNLINSADPSTTQFIDGIKKFTDSGWVLVIPDGDEPVFKIYSEAESKEEAERLTNYYCEKIEKLLQECSIY